MEVVNQVDTEINGYDTLPLRLDPVRLQEATDRMYAIFFRTYKKRIFLRLMHAFKKWAIEFPLITKCEEIGKQLRERTLMLETIRSSYLKDVVSTKHYLDQLDKIKWDEMNQEKWGKDFYDLHTIPSADVRNLVEKALKTPHLSSNQLRDNLVECGLLDPETSKTVNPWENSRAYRRLCRLEKGSQYNYPSHIEGECLSVSAPTNFKVYIRYCENCIGVTALVKSWNTTIEEAIRFKVEYNAVDAKIEDFKKLVNSLQDIIISKEEEIVDLTKKMQVYEETNSWFTKWTKIKSLPQMIDEYEETIRQLQNTVLMAAEDKQSTCYHLSMQYDEKLSYHLLRQQELQDQLVAQQNSMMQDIALREKLSKELQSLMLENHQLKMSNQDLIRKQSQSASQIDDMLSQIDYLSKENAQFQQLLQDKDEQFQRFKQEQTVKIEELQQTIDRQDKQLEKYEDDMGFLRKENREKQNLLTKNAKQIETLEKTIEDLERELYRYRFARKRTFKSYAIAVRCCVKIFRALRSGNYASLGSLGYRLTAFQGVKRNTILSNDLRSMNHKYQQLVNKNANLLQVNDELQQRIQNLEDLLRQRQLEYDDLYERYQQSQDSITQLQALLQNAKDHLEQLRKELEAEREFLNGKFAGDFQALLIRIKIFGYLQRNLAKQFYSSFIKAKGIIEMMDLPLEIKHLYRDIALMNDDEAFGIIAPVMDEALIEKAKINKPRKANIVTSLGEVGSDGGTLSEGPSRAASVLRGNMGTTDKVNNVVDVAEDGGHVADVVRSSASMQQQNHPQRKKMSRQLQIPNSPSTDSTKTDSISANTPLTSRRSVGQSSLRQNLPYRVSTLQHPSAFKKDYKAIFRNFGNRYISTLKYLKSEYPFNLAMDMTFWMKWIRFGMTSRDKLKSAKALMELKQAMLLEAEAREKEKEKEKLGAKDEEEEKKQEEVSKLENEEKKNTGTSTPPPTAVQDPPNQQLEDLKSSLANQTLESIQATIPELMIQTLFATDSSRVQFFADLLLQDISCLQSLVFHMKLHLQYYKKKMILFKDLEIEYNDLFKRFKKLESTMEQNTAIKTKRQQMMKARSSNAHLLDKDVNSYLQNVMKAIDSVKEQFGGLYPGESTGSVSQGAGKSTSAPIASPSSRRSMAGSDISSPAKQFMATRSSLALGGSIGLSPDRNSPTFSRKSLANNDPTSAKSASSKKKFFPSFEESEAITTIDEHHEEKEDHEEVQEHKQRRRKGKKVKQVKDHDEEGSRESMNNESSPDRKSKRRKSKKPLKKEEIEKDETNVAVDEKEDEKEESSVPKKSISFKAYEEQLPEDVSNPTVEGETSKQPLSTPPSRLRKGFSLGKMKIPSISDPVFDLEPKNEETESLNEREIELQREMSDELVENSDSKAETDDNDDDYEDSRENLSLEESESQPSEMRTKESSLEDIQRDEEETFSREESKEEVLTQSSKAGSLDITQKAPLTTNEPKDRTDDRKTKKKVSIVEPPPMSNTNSVAKSLFDDQSNPSTPLPNPSKTTAPTFPPPLTSFSHSNVENSNSGDIEGGGVGGVTLTARSTRSHQRSFFSGGDQILSSASNSFSTARTSAPPSRTTSLMIRQTSNSKLTQIQDDIEEEDDDDFYDEDEEDDEFEDEEEEEEEEEKENENFINELELAQKEALAFMQRESELQNQISALKDENQSLLDSIEQLSEQLEKLRHQQDLMNEEIYDLKHDLHTLTLSYDEISHENTLLREIVQNEYKYHHEKVNKLFDSLQESIKRKEEERKLQQRRNKRNQGTQITCSVCAIREYYDENYEKKPNEIIKSDSRPHSPHQRLNQLYARDDDETIAEFDKAMTKAFDGEEKVLIPRFQKSDHETGKERANRLHELQGEINAKNQKNQKPFEELENYEFLEGSNIPFVAKIMQILDKQNPDQNYSRPSTAKEKRMALNTMTTQTEEDTPVILSTDQVLRTSTNKGVVYFRESNPSAGKAFKKGNGYRIKTPISNIEILRDFPSDKTAIDADILPGLNSAQIGTDSLKDPVATSEQYEKSKNVLKYARSLMSHTPKGLYNAANPNPVTTVTSTNVANSAILGISRPLSAIALNQGSSSSSLQPFLLQQNAVSPHVSMLQPPAPNHIEFPVNVTGMLNTGHNKQRPSSAIVYSANKDHPLGRNNPAMENIDSHQLSLINQQHPPLAESKFRKIKQMPPTASPSPQINNSMIFNHTIAYQPNNRQDLEDFQNYQQKLLTKEKDQETVANTAAFLQGRQLYDRVLASEYVKQLKEEERRTVRNNTRAMSTSQLPTGKSAENITGMDVGELKTSHSERMIPSANNSLMKAINITLSRPPSATASSNTSRPLSSSLQRKSNASAYPLNRNKSKLSYQFSDDADSINDFIEEDQEH